MRPLIVTTVALLAVAAAASHDDRQPRAAAASHDATQPRRPSFSRRLAQFAGSSGLGATLGGGALTGWGWGRAFATPLSPLAGSLANVYCNTTGEPPAPPRSMLFVCTRAPAVAGGIIGDIIPRFGEPVCVNMCQPASPATTCIPCTDPQLVCAREYGGGGAGGVIYVAEARMLCATPGVDGGRAITGTVPLI